MIKLISSAWVFVTTKTRLFVEYIFLTILLAVSGTCIYLYIENIKIGNDVVILKGDVQKTVDANGTLAGTVDFLVKQREKDSKAVDDLSNRITDIGVNDKGVRDNVGKLEKSDDKVKAYLDTNVPDDLRGLLQSKQAADSISDQRNKNKAPEVPVK